MAIVVAVLSLPFCLCALTILRRARMQRTPKLSVMGAGLGVTVVLGCINPYLLFTTTGMCCFMCLWLSSIGVLRPTHTIAYSIRLKKIQFIRVLIQMVGAPTAEEIQKETE